MGYTCTMKIKAFHVVAYLGIITAWLIVLYVGYYSFYPFKVIDIYNSPYPVQNEGKVVRQGEDLIFFVDFCKYMSVHTETTQHFIDEIIYTLPRGNEVNAPEGCYQKNVRVEVPETLPPSTYIYRITADHQVHPTLRVIRVVAETEPFEVVAE